MAELWYHTKPLCCKQTLGFQTSEKEKGRLKLIQFCTQVPDRNLAGWKPLYHREALVCLFVKRD